MTLHEEEARAITYTPTWCAAYVQRTGRAHIIRMPCIWIPPEDMAMPRYLRERDASFEESQQHWREKMSKVPFIPYRISERVVGLEKLRMCSTPQRADSWTIEWPRVLEPRRGVCKACWEHNDIIEKTGITEYNYRQFFIRSHQRTGAANPESSHQWVESERRVILREQEERRIENERIAARAY